MTKSRFRRRDFVVWLIIRIFQAHYRQIFTNNFCGKLQVQQLKQLPVLKPAVELF